MSWVSENAKSVAGGLSFLNPLTAMGAVPAVGPALLNNKGSTAQNNGAHVQGGNQSNQRLQEIYKNIQDHAGGGTFGEGQIAAASNEYKKLQKDLDEGKLSQADFVTISDAFVPQIKTYISQVSNSGSAGASAARAAGGDAFFNDYGRDLDIYKTGRELLGRDITQAELYQLRPKFAGPNGPDTGKAYLAELSKQEQSSPEALAKKAGAFSGDVGNVFQTLLSRGATKDEADYFGRMLASGEVTPYEINQFVQQLPEYQNKQDSEFRGGLEKELGDYDSTAFNREKENILSRYTQAGIQNSSALDFAMTDALSKLTENRGRFLSTLSADQYGGNKNAARKDYESSVGRMYGNEDYTQGRSDKYLDYLTNRADQGVDYQRQRDDYMNFLSQQPKQKTSPFDYLNAGLNTINTGANVARAFA